MELDQDNDRIWETGPEGRCIRIWKKEISYLIPMERIERVMAETEIVPVPGAPAGILGVGWYENRLIPFVCPGEEKPGPARCAILLRTENGRILGVTADDIGEITDAEEEEPEGQEAFLRLLSGGG